MAVSPEVLDAIRLLVQAQATSLRGSPTQPIVRPATVEGYDPATLVVDVIVDGDLLSIPVENVTKQAVTVGERVMVMFTQPHGAYLFGFAAP